MKFARRLNFKSYEERLLTLDLYSLEYRQLKGDITVTNKTLNTQAPIKKHI